MKLQILTLSRISQGPKGQKRDPIHLFAHQIVTIEEYGKGTRIETVKSHIVVAEEPSEIIARIEMDDCGLEDHEHGMALRDGDHDLDFTDDLEDVL